MVDGGWDEWSECREFGVGHDSIETQVILGPFQYVGTKGKFKQFSKFQKWWLNSAIFRMSGIWNSQKLVKENIDDMAI